MIPARPSARPPRRRGSPSGVRGGRGGCGGGGGLACFAFLLLAVLLVPMLAPAPVSAQTAPAAAEARYLEALEAYEAVVAERDRVLTEHEILVDRQADARESGDENRARDAMAAVHVQGTRLTFLDRQVQAAAEPLREAAEEFLRALDAREEELLDALEGPLSNDARDRLNEELVQLRVRYREVEREVGPELATGARLLPELAIGPRDGPRELRAKAGLMESWAEDYDTILATVDREIELRERWIQQERGREDLMASISRFGDDRFVGGGLSGPEQDNGAGNDDGDDVTANLADLPLPEQVSRLREYRETIAESRNEALARARLFRERAEGGPG